MKNAEQLKSIFIQSIMHNRKQDDNEKMRGWGVITTVYPKKLVAFCEFVEDKVYKGNTTLDYVIKEFKIPKKYQKNSETVEKYLLTKHSFEYYRSTFAKMHKETTRRINSRFEKYRVELNNLLFHQE